jgi:hypothetical protein
MLGGPDPIDGISPYQCTDGGIDHLHFITFGYPSLYYDEAVGKAFSRFGFEMTFRLASELPPAEASNLRVQVQVQFFNGRLHPRNIEAGAVVEV